MPFHEQVLYSNRRFYFWLGVPVMLPTYFHNNWTPFYKLCWTCYSMLFDIMPILVFINASAQSFSMNVLGVYITSFNAITFLSSGILKSLFIKKYRVDFECVVQNLQIMAEGNNNNPFGDDGFSDVYTREHGKAAKLSRNFIRLMLISMFNGTIFYLVFNGLQEDSSKWLHVLPVALPFDEYKDKYWHYCVELGFILSGFMCSGLRCFAHDGMFFVILSVHVAQLKYLRRLGGKMFQDGVELESKEVITDKIRWWIQQHQRVLRNLVKFRQISNAYMTITYTIVLLEIFLLAITITLLQQWDPVMKLVVSGIIFIQLVNLYIISTVGDVLYEEGMDLLSNCWISETIKYNKWVRNAFLFMMTRTRYPIRITAGGLHPLSSRSFGNLLKTTLSTYLTILQIRLKHS